MESLLNIQCDNPNLYSPAALAFLGDCVFELLAREHLVCQGNCPAKKLHNRAVSMVNCSAQAEGVLKIEDMLTEEERDVLKRGRNYFPGHTPKNASSADYHMATALECLFGWLYLSKKIDRIRELFLAINK